VQGSPQVGHKSTGASEAVAIGEYAARKRRIYLRSLLAAVLIAVPLAARGPILGLEFAIAVLCGLGNMLLLTRANERLLSGRTSVGAHAFGSVMRVVASGAVPVFFAPFVPWWAFGVYFGGFFVPLVFYALDLRRSYRDLPVNG